MKLGILVLVIKIIHCLENKSIVKRETFDSDRDSNHVSIDYFQYGKCDIEEFFEVNCKEIDG